MARLPEWLATRVVRKEAYLGFLIKSSYSMGMPERDYYDPELYEPKKLTPEPAVIEVDPDPHLADTQRMKPLGLDETFPGARYNVAPKIPEAHEAAPTWKPSLWQKIKNWFR